MREFVDFMKEILMIKEEEGAVVGLSGFRKPMKKVLQKSTKKVSKEIKLSDLMRRT